MASPTYDTIIVGGGAAGIGVSVALKDAGIENFLVLERDRIGASFEAWPAETRFLTPSFPTNSMGMLDLNSISIGTSPAFSLQTEHPTGSDFAEHVRQVAEIVNVPVREKTNATHYENDDDFVIETDEDVIHARHVIWAAGEFSIRASKWWPAASSAVTRPPSGATTNSRKPRPSSSEGTRAGSTPPSTWPHAASTSISSTAIVPGSGYVRPQHRTVHLQHGADPDALLQEARHPPPGHPVRAVDLRRRLR